MKEKIAFFGPYYATTVYHDARSTESQTSVNDFV